MIPRLACLRLAVASSFVVAAAFAQNPPPASPSPLPTNPPAAAPAATAPTVPPATNSVPIVAPAAPEDEMVQLKLPDADIDTVLSALEIYTGRIILRPQALQTATYNLKITKPIPKSEAILAIETVLALNQVGVVPLGDKFLKVVNLQMSKTEAPEMISGSTLDRPASGQIATKLFQLEFMRVGELQPVLQPVLNPFLGGPVTLPNANAVLITDSISNLQRVEVLLQQLDKPSTAGMKAKFFTLKNGAKASDVVTKLRNILQGTLQVQLGQGTSYSADDRTNQIVVVTDPRQWDFFADLIDQLDQKSDPNTRTDVIPLKHAVAEDVVTILSRIIQGQTSTLQKSGGSVRTGQPGTNMLPVPGAPPQPAAPATLVSGSSSGNPNLEGTANEFSAFMTVVNDKRSNSVVVFGTTDDIRLARDLVDKLDIVLAQVRIEVVIAEVTLEDNNETGIGALGLKLDGDKLVGFSGALNPASAFSVTNGTITRPGGTATVSGSMDLAAEIAIGTSLRKRNNSIITVPAIVTSHGHQAKFFDGETRPVVTGTIQSAAGATTGLASSSTVTQQQIGTTLTVTPFIGVDGSVQLDLVQSVEDVTGEVIVDQNKQYIIGRRETTNYITAKSGEIKVMSGFRKSSNIKENSRLGPIPIIGDIFGPRKKNNQRQELIFFIRPTVVTNEAAVDNAEAIKQIEQWSTKDEVKKELDPNYQIPKPRALDRILPK